MNERPYVWHANKFKEAGEPLYEGPNPWTVTLGRPEHLNDFRAGHSAATLEAAMDMAVALAEGQAVS